MVTTGLQLIGKPISSLNSVVSGTGSAFFGFPFFAFGVNVLFAMWAGVGAAKGFGCLNHNGGLLNRWFLG